jgi:hypothetical protein
MAEPTGTDSYSRSLRELKWWAADVTVSAFSRRVRWPGSPLVLHLRLHCFPGPAHHFHHTNLGWPGLSRPLRRPGLLAGANPVAGHRLSHPLLLSHLGTDSKRNARSSLTGRATRCYTETISRRVWTHLQIFAGDVLCLSLFSYPHPQGLFFAILIFAPVGHR